jgi:hypothetical protein
MKGRFTRPFSFLAFSDRSAARLQDGVIMELTMRRTLQALAAPITLLALVGAVMVLGQIAP